MDWSKDIHCSMCCRLILTSETFEAVGGHVYCKDCRARQRSSTDDKDLPSLLVDEVVKISSFGRRMTRAEASKAAAMLLMMIRQYFVDRGVMK